jgi:hypothetical protein
MVSHYTNVKGSGGGPVLTWYRTGTEAMLDLVILGASSALEWMVAARSGRRALR